MTMIQTALLALLVLGYMIYRQFVTRPVTRNDVLLPVIGIVYLGVMYFGKPSNDGAVGLVVAATLFGAGTGLLSAAVVRVWHDGATGLVMQRGGWKYLLVLVGLIVVRLLLRLATSALKFDVTEAALNDAFIGMAVGNYAGRALLVGVRALALLGWDPNALPGRRDIRSMR